MKLLNFALYRTSLAANVRSLGETQETQRKIAYIQQNAEICDIDALREQCLQRMPVGKTPAQQLKRTREAHLQPFQAFFRRTFNSHAQSPRVRAFLQNLRVAARLGWRAEAFHLEQNSRVDTRFSFTDDMLEPMFDVIFSEKDLLSSWMQALDERVKMVSCNMLRDMDARTKQWSAPPVHKDVVLVGGGPLTSIVASVLSPFFHITVVSEQNALGKPWRNRHIYINSSSNVRDDEDAPLPLLGGATTRVIGRKQYNSLDSELLLSDDTLAMRCDAGNIVQYAAGPRLGCLVATNIVFNADDYLLNQRVEVELTRQNADGTVRLTLVDTHDGSRRELNANAVIFLTGPGKERSRVASNSLYEQEATRLKQEIHAARERTRWFRESLDKLSDVPVSSGIKAQQVWLKRRLVSLSAISLPRLLNLTDTEDILEYWCEDLKADPELYPYELLLPQTVAYVGNGDTMRTVKELQEGRGPKSAYPDSRFRFFPSIEKSCIYNEGTNSPKQYAGANRRRYRRTFTSTTTSQPFKVERYRLIVDSRNSRERMEVLFRDEFGLRRRRRYDRVWDCTGLDRTPLQYQLPFPSRLMRDMEGNVVGVSNREGNILIAGSATGFREQDFPRQLRDIINVLGVAQNTIALWVYGALVERLAYTYAATHPYTKR